MSWLFWTPIISACISCSPSFRECPPIADELLAALPSRLSNTGLFADVQTETLAEGVLPFAPRFELWSDRAEKRRWVYLPPGAQIDTTDPDAWNFPSGTKLWKEFTRDGVRVETRLLYKHGTESTAWTRVAFVWRDDGDAWATPEGLADARGTSHDVPSAAQCTGCHRGTRSGVLGFSAVQLPVTGEGDHIGVADLRDTGRFSTQVPTLEVPGAAETRAALGYLHVNCSHCHNLRRPAREGSRCFDPKEDFDFTLRVGDLGTPETTATYRTAIGEVIAAGKPGDSDIMSRMRSRDEWWGMPALGTEVVDETGVQLLETWIRSL